MTTLEPASPARHWLGVSALAVQLGSAGSFGDGRGAWLAAGRPVDQPGGQALASEDPRYWDLYGKLETRLGQRATLRGSLFADDRLTFEEEVDGETKRFDTAYASSTSGSPSTRCSARASWWRPRARSPGSARPARRRGRETCASGSRPARPRRRRAAPALDLGRARDHLLSGAPAAPLLERLRPRGPTSVIRWPASATISAATRPASRQFREPRGAVRHRPYPPAAVARRRLGLRHVRCRESGQNRPARAQSGLGGGRRAWCGWRGAASIRSGSTSYRSRTAKPLSRRSSARSTGARVQTALPGGAERPLLAARLEVTGARSRTRARAENLFSRSTRFPKSSPTACASHPAAAAPRRRRVLTRCVRRALALVAQLRPRPNRRPHRQTDALVRRRQALARPRLSVGERWRSISPGVTTPAGRPRRSPPRPCHPEPEAGGPEPGPDDEPGEPARGAAAAIRCGPVLGRSAANGCRATTASTCAPAGAGAPAETARRLRRHPERLRPAQRRGFDCRSTKRPARSSARSRPGREFCRRSESRSSSKGPITGTSHSRGKEPVLVSRLEPAAHHRHGHRLFRRIHRSCRGPRCRAPRARVGST
jgi:hypothetical protein